jgi:hypothetical protein
MFENDEIRPFKRPFQDAGLRLADPVVRKDGDITHVHVGAVNDEGTVVAHGSCAVKLLIMAAVLPGVPSCDLMEGGMGI